jgi:hypothetical protein
MTTMKATKTLGVALAVLLLPHIAVAETWLTLEASEYPPEVKKALDDVRSACKGEEHEVVDDPQAGVTIIDLDRDGSKDILLEAWRTCSVEMKGAGCNAAGCVLQIFKQVGPHKWKSVFDETIDPVWVPQRLAGRIFPSHGAIGQSKDYRPMPRSFGQRV